MRIAVLGPGGVGGLVAGALVRGRARGEHGRDGDGEGAPAGAQVVVVARGSTVRAIEARGLRVRSVLLGDFVSHPRAVEHLREEVDALVVATKAAGLTDALERVAVQPPLVLPLLNGLDHLATLRARFGPEPVVAGTIRVEADRPEPGVVVHTSRFLRVDMASRYEAMRAPMQLLAAALTDAGVPARVYRPPGHAADGPVATGTFPPDGSAAKSMFPSDGPVAKGTFPADGSAAKSMFPADGSVTTGTFPPDGSAAKSAFPADGSAATGTLSSDGGEAQVMWSKLVRLNALACTTSAYDLPLGPILSTPELRAELVGAIEEGCAVARAEGADIAAGDPLGELSAAHDTLGSSMQRDIAAGREPELDAIPGAVLRAAARHGIACPTIERLTATIAQRTGVKPPQADTSIGARAHS